MNVDRDTLDLYVLGVLDDAETAQVEAYLLAHPEVLREVRAEREALAQAAFTTPAPVPDGAEERLLARLRAETAPAAPATRVPSPVPVTAPTVSRRAPAHRTPSWPLIALAAAAVVAGVVLLPTAQDWNTTRAYTAARNSAGAQSQELRDPQGTRVGELTRTADGRVLVLMDRAAAGDRSYQAWRIAGGQVASLGVFEGRLFATDVPVEGNATFGLTVEPRGGRPTPTLPPLSTATL